MFERFTDRARRVTVLADEQARMMCDDQVSTGHLLVALAAEGEGVAAKALSVLGVTEAQAREAVLARCPAGDKAPAGHLEFTPRLKKALELALRESLQLGCSYVGTEHLLLGLIRLGDGTGVDALADLGVEPGTVRRKVTEMLHGYAERERAARAREVTVRETALGDIYPGRATRGPHVVIAGREYVRRISPGEAREAAAALTAAADEIDASGG